MAVSPRGDSFFFFFCLTRLSRRGERHLLLHCREQGTHKTNAATHHSHEHSATEVSVQSEGRKTHSHLSLSSSATSRLSDDTLEIKLKPSLTLTETEEKTGGAETKGDKLVNLVSTTIFLLFLRPSLCS